MSVQQWADRRLLFPQPDYGRLARDSGAIAKITNLPARAKTAQLRFPSRFQVEANHISSGRVVEFLRRNESK
jgi:hypothetical protein